jgi:DHA1 family multidrug resistance protein-like MFS transporter
MLWAVAMGMTMGLTFTSVAALTVETVPPEFRGLTMGGYNSAIYLSMMVSSAALGPIIGLTGFRHGFLVTMGITLLLTGMAQLLMKGFSPSRQSPT